MGASRAGRASRCLTTLGAARTLIHLDTSFLIRALVRGSAEDRQLREWLRAGDALGISAVAWAEFRCGPLEAGQVELAEAVVPVRASFAEEDAVLAARLFNEAGRRRGSMVDCMIGAAAVGAEASLATANASDFARFTTSGLVLVP